MIAPINPYAHLKAVAGGDVTAMRLLAREAKRLWDDEGHANAAREGLMFARLAFAKTESSSDAGLMLCLLARSADSSEGVERESYEAEAIALMSILADAGLDVADAGLPGMADAASRGTVELAKELREMMTEGTA